MPDILKKFNEKNEEELKKLIQTNFFSETITNIFYE